MVFSRLPMYMLLEWLESVLRGFVSIVRVLWRIWMYSGGWGGHTTARGEPTGDYTADKEGEEE